jgi:hypothetical protein
MIEVIFVVIVERNQKKKKGGVGGVIRECITHTTIDLMYFKLKLLLQQFYGFD